MNRLGGDVQPPAGIARIDIQPVHIGYSKKIGGRTVPFQVGNLQRRDCRTAGLLRVPEGRNAGAWVRTHVVIEQIALASDQRDQGWGVAKIAWAHENIRNGLLAPTGDRRRLWSIKIACDVPNQFGAGFLILTRPRTAKDRSWQRVFIVIRINLNGYTN